MTVSRTGLNYQHTPLNIPEERWPQQYRGGNLKSMMLCRCSRWYLLYRTGRHYCLVPPNKNIGQFMSCVSTQHISRFLQQHSATYGNVLNCLRIVQCSAFNQWSFQRVGEQRFAEVPSEWTPTPRHLTTPSRPVNQHGQLHRSKPWAALYIVIWEHVGLVLFCYLSNTYIL